MRPRDPRRLLRRDRSGPGSRDRSAPGRVRLVETPAGTSNPDGSVTTKQVADVTLPRRELDRIWQPEYLERLARTYWVFLSRFTLGLIHVRYTDHGREVVLLGPPLRLLTFHPPAYDVDATRGCVTWRIHRGILVAPRGRGKGYLQLCVERPPESNGGDEVTVRVSSEVASFFPSIAMSWVPSRMIRLAAWIYKQTQLRVHVIVTNSFLRSLARLELPESVVGSLSRQRRLPPARSRSPSEAGRRR